MSPAVSSKVASYPGNSGRPQAKVAPDAVRVSLKFSVQVASLSNRGTGRMPKFECLNEAFRDPRERPCHKDPMQPLSSGTPYVSVFDSVFDVIVVGGGYIGWAAARELAAVGRSVLLLEPSGQLLWESTQALQCVLAGGDGHPAWRQWRQSLPVKNDAFLDIAATEVHAAWEIATGKSPFRVLFYAMPAALCAVSGGIHSLTVATKAGSRRLRAHHWVDASENGVLGVLWDEGNRTERRTARIMQTICLQSMVWDRYDAQLAEFCRQEGLELSRSLRATERRLSWVDAGEPWHRTVIGILGRMREAVCATPEVIVSQCSTRAFPFYEGETGRPPVLNRPDNLLNLSPAFSSGSFASLAARFSWGSDRAAAWLRTGAPSRSPGNVPEAPAPARGARSLRCEVAVVGTGTSGALAALAAARQGADVLALEFASFPGGVGTGAAISAYFHGLEGGLQVEIDRRTFAMDVLLQGEAKSKHRWHYESKKLAILEAFQEAGVRFLNGMLLCGVEQGPEGTLDAIVMAGDDGPVRIEAATFIDCTGDGDLCAFAGNAYRSGRAGDGRPLAYSQPALVFRTGDDRLIVNTENFDAGWVDSTDPEDLSRARLEGVSQYAGRLAPNCNLFAIAPLIGVRQSRQIETDYILTFSNLVNHTPFPDTIGQAGAIADTHSIDYEFEDDEAIFFYWVCRLFRHPLKAHLPYRMLLPKELQNVWIACRASGMEVTASYAVRMQRDMQRLGEAAGVAAALAVGNGGRSREVDLSELRSRLDRDPAGPSRAEVPELSVGEAARLLGQGRPGIHLWRIMQDRERYGGITRDALRHPSATVSFYAATVLAMWNDTIAEPRLVQAIADREEGLPPSKDNTGAHGQEIDIPFWLLAAVLLRRCGTSRCLGRLRELADDPSAILNVRTALALTLERLALAGRISFREAAEIADLLIRHPLPDRLLEPSRSIWRTLRKEKPVELRNRTGIEVREDHLWQLHLIICRIRSRLGQPFDDLAGAYRNDARAIVRRAFAKLAA